MKTTSFKIPLMSPSMNSLYNVIFSLRRVELKKDVMVFKTRAKMFVPQIELKDNEALSINIKFHTAWRHANGRLKRKDVQNMLKVVIDLVSEKLGVDDSVFFRACGEKIESSEEYMTVQIGGINGRE